MGLSGSNLGVLFEIGADPSKAQAALSKFGVSAEKMFKLTAAGAAAAGAALFAAAKRTADYGDEILKASQRTGVGVRELSALRFAAEQSDVSFGELQKGLQLLARNMSGLSASGSELERALDALGVQGKTAEGNLRPMRDVLLDVADRFAKAKDSGEKAAIAMTVFGRSGAALIPLLNQGREGIERLEEQAQRLGITFSDESARAAQEFKDSLGALSKVMRGVEIQVGNRVIPLLNEMLIQFVALGQEGVPSFRKAMEDLSIGLGILTLSLPAALADLLTWSDQGSQALLKWADAAGLNDERTESLTEKIIKLRDALKSPPTLPDQILKVADAADKAGKKTKEWVAVDTSRWFLQFYSDLQRTLPALETFKQRLEKLQETTELTFEAPPPAFDLLAESSGRMAEALATNFSFAQEAMQALQATGVQTFERMSQAMGQNAAFALVYGKSISAALAEAAKAALASISAEAIQRAIFETAFGFASLARLDFRGAALHFKSAALFAAVGGTSAAVGRALPSAGAAPAGAVPVGVGGPGGAAAGVLTGGREEQQGPVINVFFEGPFYGGEEGLRELVRDISEAVNGGDVVLHSTSSAFVTAKS